MTGCAKKNQFQENIVQIKFCILRNFHIPNYHPNILLNSSQTLHWSYCYMKDNSFVRDIHILISRKNIRVGYSFIRNSKFQYIYQCNQTKISHKIAYFAKFKPKILGDFVLRCGKLTLFNNLGKVTKYLRFWLTWFPPIKCSIHVTLTRQ